MKRQTITVDHVCLTPSQQIGRHQQATWELSYIIKGQGVRTIGGQTEPFEPGDMVLIPPEDSTSLLQEWLPGCPPFLPYLQAICRDDTNNV